MNSALNRQSKIRASNNVIYLWIKATSKHAEELRIDATYWERSLRIEAIKKR